MPGRTPAPDPPFDIVHVFRLAAMAAAKPYLASARRRHLDLDDIESKTHKRIEALCRANGLVEAADREEAESRRCELLETAIFRSFDRVYVCSEADRDALAQRCPAELLILPNAVRLPASPPGRSPSEPYRFLFIGTMGYYPNFDACVWFCRKVAPILKRTAPEPFGVDIAGSGSAGGVGGPRTAALFGSRSPGGSDLRSRARSHRSSAGRRRNADQDFGGFQLPAARGVNHHRRQGNYRGSGPRDPHRRQSRGLRLPMRGAHAGSRSGGPACGERSAAGDPTLLRRNRETYRLFSASGSSSVRISIRRRAAAVQE